MKSYKKIVIGVIIIVLITVASVIYLNRENLKETIYTKTQKDEKKEFSIILENAKCNSKEKQIYKYEDGKVINSRCGEVYYSDKDNTKIALSDALSKNYISIKDITDNMEAILAAYDGGSTAYEFNDENNKMSKSKFRLEVCNQINGSHDMLFLSSNSDNYKCLK
ncbi:MAG: hypothetical protein OSJ70_03330 [Bacilli bacterium]|nr:hypothetical protein [Bacilli bacterium]